MKRLAIFDLDDTLLRGDSEFHWAKFTVKKGFIKKGGLSRENKRI